MSEAMVREEATITVPGGVIAADVLIPGRARGAVIFAHGSGSSRFSGRNRFVAMTLAEASLCTVLADLLTAQESAVDERTAQVRFDIRRLSDRVLAVLDWTLTRPGLRTLPSGLFGASTGAAAALIAAAERPSRVRAIVSRGGRPDLAGEALERVRAPTLLLVGGRDREVLRLNEAAAARMRCEARVEVVPGATHLFEEPGALEDVSALARDWFTHHLVSTVEAERKVGS